jgi:hypothetical protein
MASLRSIAMPNVAGKAHSFFYQDANATRWSASLQDLTVDFVGGEDDPDFEHVGHNPEKLHG